jgi:hypothetical protein
MARAHPFAKGAVSERKEQLAQAAGSTPAAIAAGGEQDLEEVRRALEDGPGDPPTTATVSGPGPIGDLEAGFYRVRHPHIERLAWEGNADSPHDAMMHWAAKHGIITRADKGGRQRVQVDTEPNVEMLGPERSG